MPRSSGWSALPLVLLLFLSAPASATQPRLVVELGHATPIGAAAWSPDGRRVLTGSYAENAARIWDLDTGLQVQRFMGAPADRGAEPGLDRFDNGFGILAVAFSPDGRRALTGSYDRTARLWDVETGREIRRFGGHTRPVHSLALSPDGRWLLTGAYHDSARLWDVETGREILRLEGHAGAVLAVAISPDGTRLLTGGEDRSARLWDIGTGRESGTFTGHPDAIEAVAFSPDGGRILTGGRDRTIRVWDVETGREVRVLEGHAEGICTVAFSPDGGRVLSSSGGRADMSVRLWDAETGREIWRFVSPDSFPWGGAAFSPDGRRVLLGGEDWTPLFLDAESGEVIRKIESRAEVITGAAVSPDGRRLLAGSVGSAFLWDLERGGEILRSAGHEWPRVAFSADGPRILASTEDGSGRIRDAATGEPILDLAGHTARVRDFAFSSDGRSVLTASDDGTARLWTADAGREIRRLEGHTAGVNSVVFAPDGRRAVTGSSDHTARLWDLGSGRELRRFEGHGRAVTSVRFSPDGSRLLTGSADRTVRIWEVESGRELRRLEGHGWPVMSVTFSSDGRRVLSGSWDATARLWDAGTGEEIRRFTMSGASSFAGFSPDGRWVFTASQDGLTRFWDAETGEELCGLCSFKDGTWAVVDGDGRFDASNGGDVEGLHWVVGDEPIALSQLKERYYDPGLLAKHLGFNPEPLREVAAFDAPRLYPMAKVAPPTAEDPRLRIDLADRGGGIGKVVVLVNGKEVTADARGGSVAPDAKEATLTLDLSGDPRLKPGEANTIEVFAYNAEGYLRSRGLRVEYAPPGEAAPPPSLWAVVCGVSDYRGEAIDLKYPGKDAADFAGALRLAAEGLLGAERVHVALLVTEPVEGATRPTRENLAKAFEGAKSAKPDDLLVVYLSGHGVNQGGPDGDFHYLLCDASGTDLTDPEVRRQATVSSAELTEWIKAIPATKRQVLILDTCASGRVVEKLSERREVAGRGSKVRALDRLKDRTGVFVLAGCAADRVSYEASRYGQGLLTYSLLLGMRGAALREESYVDVGRLFAFAADTVPELAKDIGGIQRPVLAQPTGGASFDIGRLTAETRAKVPLMEAKPLYLRCSFQEERRPRDGLGLGRAVEAALRDALDLIFVDAGEMPGAFEIAGRYRVTGGKVAADVTVYRGEEEVATFAVEGVETDLAGLAARIVERCPR